MTFWKYLLYTSPITFFQFAFILYFADALKDHDENELESSADQFSAGWFFTWALGLIHFIVVGCCGGKDAAKACFMFYPGLSSGWDLLWSLATWLLISNVTLLSAVFVPAVYLYRLEKKVGMDEKELDKCENLLRKICLPCEIGENSPFQMKKKLLKKYKDRQVPDGCRWWISGISSITVLLTVWRFYSFMPKG